MTSAYIVEDYDKLSEPGPDYGETDTTPEADSPFPPPILPIKEPRLAEFRSWLDEWLMILLSSHEAKQRQWAEEEKSYRAESEGPREIPFIGACGDVVPLVAMAVDPIHARIDVGVFKSDPVFRVKPLIKLMQDYADPLEKWMNYYQKYKLEMRRVASPRFLELAKHGTCVFKTVYDCTEYDVQTYTKQWAKTKRKVTKFKGPRVFGISLGDFMFPPNYQHVQDCPIVVERQRLTYDQLKIAQASKKLANVEKIKAQTVSSQTRLEAERAKSANHEDPLWHQRYHEVYEIWCDYDINGDGLPESLVVTYHYSTQTILQLRYNWYFHQRKPYTVIPYTVTNDSIYGMGITEMTKPMQDMITQLHRNAVDNTYLANIRMFVAKRDSGIEQTPKIFTGRVFHVDDPSKDFVPFQCAEVYPSTLTERQNIFGLAEKRTGVSDYLTGRESPIVGTRATATSTLALIQEGTKRVEEVLENIRNGFSEIAMNCLWIWVQYGTAGLEDVVFEDDDVAEKLKSFFDKVDESNINGALGIDLSATDAASNRAAQQQLQLAIIQVMMNYLEKTLQAGQLGISAMQTQPQITELVSEIAKSARKMFHDLLVKYDIPNPDDYLPDLERFLSGVAGGQAPVGGLVDVSSMAMDPGGAQQASLPSGAPAAY